MAHIPVLVGGDHLRDKILIPCVRIPFCTDSQWIQQIQQICATLLFNTNWHYAISRKSNAPTTSTRLSSRSIGFSWNCIMSISIKKQSCKFFQLSTCRKYCSFYIKFVKNKHMTDRQIVLFEQFLVPLLRLEHTHNSPHYQLCGV